MSNNQIEDLIYIFSKLPGLGLRSARRIVLHLLKNKDLRMNLLIQSLIETYQTTHNCKVCNNIDVEEICKICSDSARDTTSLVIVENVSDLWAIERSKIFKGKYHILGGALSAGKGISPDDLGLPLLLKRIKDCDIKEIIIATNSNLDGQTTAFFITEYLRDFDIKISRLASGIPIGGELEYLDEGTVSAAFNLRQPF